MSYLGLDLAGSTGWALWSPGQSRPRGGTLKLRRRDPEEIAPDLEQLRQHLADLHRVEPITHIWYEAPILMRVDTVRKLQFLLGLTVMVEWWSHRCGVVCRQATMEDWRKHFLGYCKGGRDNLKKAAVDACKLRGWEAGTHDAAEAHGVLEYGLATIKVDRPWRDVYLFNGLIGRATA